MRRRKKKLPPSLRNERLFHEFMLELDLRCPVITIPTGPADPGDLLPGTCLAPDPANYKFEPYDDLDD